MKEFTDSDGRSWTAEAVAEDTLDYTGRYHLVMRPADGSDPVELRDIRWNNERTARRSIETMSTTELRRRLRSATRRSEPVPVA